MFLQKNSCRQKILEVANCSSGTHPVELAIVVFLIVISSLRAIKPTVGSGVFGSRRAFALRVIQASSCHTVEFAITQAGVLSDPVWGTTLGLRLSEWKFDRCGTGA